MQKVLAFISAMMFFLQTLYSPDAAKSYQSSARRRGGPDRGSKPGSGSGGARISGMSSLGGSSGNGAIFAVAPALVSPAPVKRRDRLHNQCL